MTLNPNKTESLTFTRKRAPEIPDLHMNGTKIKHLGITLQQNAKWNIHITDITNKAKKKLDILRGLIYKLDRRSLEKLYLCYIRPTL